MQSTVGPVRTVQMSYTSAGKSTGVATVMFKNKGDANKAHSACTLGCLLLRWWGVLLTPTQTTTG